MIARIAFGVFALTIIAWLWWLELRLAHLLDYAEQIVDRDHGPALPLDTTPMPVPDLAGGLRTRHGAHSQIGDPTLARVLADHEDQRRAGLAGGGQP